VYQQHFKLSTTSLQETVRYDVMCKYLLQNHQLTETANIVYQTRSTLKSIRQI